MEVRAVRFTLAILLLISSAPGQLTPGAHQNSRPTSLPMPPGKRTSPGDRPGGFDHATSYRPGSDRGTDGAEHATIGMATGTPAFSFVYLVDSAFTQNWWGTERHLYAFDANARMTSHLMGRWSGDRWVDYYRVTFSYHSSGNVLTYLVEELTDGLWTNQYRDAHAYDANGNLLTDSSQYWQDGQWLHFAYSEYTYDSNGNLVVDLSVSAENGQPVYIWRDAYTYDEGGNVISDTSAFWDHGELQFSFVWTYAYTAGTLMLSQRRDILHDQESYSLRWLYFYDVRGNVGYIVEQRREHEWKNNARETFLYDAAGYLVSRMYEEMTSDHRLGLHWEGVWCYNYEYDPAGNMLSEIYRAWDDDQWIDRYRWSYSYDIQGKMIWKFHDDWRSPGAVFPERWTYGYDTEGNLTSILHHEKRDSSWVPADGVEELRDSAGNRYSFTFTTLTLARDLVITGIPAPYSLSQNYPNPFNSGTTIQYELPTASVTKLAVYDLLGREVSVLVDGWRVSGVYQAKFDATGLASGVYFYRLTAGDFAQTKKFVVLR